MKEKVSRRDFLTRSGRTAAGLGLGLVSGELLNSLQARAEQPISPKEKIVVGFIGCGVMGRQNFNDFIKQPDVEIAAVCDVYLPRAEDFAKKTDGKAAVYQDFRRVIERKDIDAVVVSTPDHWHAIPTILACKAGKDVYVEKPVAHNIVEGRAMVKAARANKRIVQVGTQQRSGTHFQRAVDVVKSGKIGKVTLARCWNNENHFPNGVGSPPDSDPPEGLDWNMWLGPAPEKPFNPIKFSQQFRKFWDYAGGKITDWGTHLIDVVLWAMSIDAPLAVSASGGKYGLEDMSDVPDTMEAVYDFPGFTMVYSFRGCCDRGIDGKRYGIQFHGTDGTLFVDRSGFQIFPEGNRMKDVDVELTGGTSDQHATHVRDFLDCVKSRNLPASDIEIGHRASSAAMLGNIAYRTGRKIKWDGERERVIGDREASRLLSRAYRKPWSVSKGGIG